MLGSNDRANIGIFVLVCAGFGLLCGMLIAGAGSVLGIALFWIGALILRETAIFFVERVRRGS